MAELKAELDLGWAQEETQAEGFATFRALEQGPRDALLAYALAQTLMPQTATNVYDDVHIVLEDEVLPNLRDVWTPDEAFLKRLTKPDLLTILAKDLGMEQEAKSMEGFKKSGIVTYLVQLFAEPFATLSQKQSDAVANWCPDFLQRKLELAEEEELVSKAA